MLNPNTTNSYTTWLTIIMGWKQKLSGFASLSSSLLVIADILERYWMEIRSNNFGYGVNERWLCIFQYIPMQRKWFAVDISVFGS